jgi:hypothetical protein
MNEINTAVEKLKEQSLKDPSQEGKPEVVTDNTEVNSTPIPNVEDQAQTAVPEVSAQTQSEAVKVEERTQTVIPISSGFKVDPDSKAGRVVAAKAMGEPIDE